MNTAHQEKRVKAVQSRARSKIRALRQSCESWASVGLKLGGLNRGTLCAVARGKRKASPAVLKALDLPVIVLQPVPVCLIHGYAHEGLCPGRKTRKGQVARDLFATSTAALQAALDGRKEV